MDYIVFAVLTVVFALLVWRSVRRKPKGQSTRAYRPKIHRFAAPPPATELMKRVEELQRSNAQWPEIQQVLGASDILATIRGPHLFAPRVGLNVIKHGCEIAIQKNPRADWWSALAEAKASMERVTRCGD
jgi:hypothetical protein